MKKRIGCLLLALALCLTLLPTMALAGSTTEIEIYLRTLSANAPETNIKIPKDQLNKLGLKDYYHSDSYGHWIDYGTFNSTAELETSEGTYARGSKVVSDVAAGITDAGVTKNGVTTTPISELKVTWDTLSWSQNSGRSESWHLNGELRMYTVTLKLNDGTNDTYDTRYCIKGTNVNSGLPAKPVREDYTFAGWYTAENGGEKITTIPELTGDTTYYAHWTEGHTHPVCGETCSHSGEDKHSNVTWKPVSSLSEITAGTSETPKYYYLTAPVTLGSRWEAPDNVVLCLNGNHITAKHNNTAINVENTFTLTDCTEDPTQQGKITHGKNEKGETYSGRGVYVNSGTFTMYGGCITGNTDTSIVSNSTESYSGASGGGVSVGDYGTFTMYGGSITHNTASSERALAAGGGVEVRGTFHLYGGEIRNNTATSIYSSDVRGGGVYIATDGEFRLHNGEIRNNTASSTDPEKDSGAAYGGGVYVGGTFTMEKGSISDNTVTSTRNWAFGGGVYVYYMFTMSGGEITGNTATGTGDGGGVFVNTGGTFQMSNDSHITRNTGYRGGGVSVERGSYYGPGDFTMASGKITDNNAEYGGGVYISGNFTMNGGEISSNQATSKSGGVYVNTYSTFTVSGAPKITSNTLKGSTNNVYLNNGTSIGIGTGLADGASIGVTPAELPGEDNSVTIATRATSGDEKYFTADKGGDYEFKLVDNGKIVMSKTSTLPTPPVSEEHKHPICEGTTCTDPNHDTQHRDDVTFGTALAQNDGGTLKKGNQEWIFDNTTTISGPNATYVLESMDGASSPATYYLDSDLVLFDPIEVKGNVVLCLNGHKISVNSDRIGVYDIDTIYVDAGATLTLCDCKGSGTITHGTKQSSTEQSSTEKYPGKGVSVSGTFNMYGGSISGNRADGSGGGVRVSENGTFRMYGGSISDNGFTIDKANHIGGGVYVDGGSFTMYGGSITDNSASYGGGVYVTDGSFAMSGGEISGNTDTWGGGAGVYLASNASASLTGGSIIGNSATADGGVGSGVSMVSTDDESPSLTISGNVQIHDNFRNGTLNPQTGLYEKGENGTASNIYLSSGKTITIGDALASGARIGVTLDQYYADDRVFTSGWKDKMSNANPADYFTSDSSEYNVVLDTSTNEVKLAVPVSHTHVWTYEANGATITATCINCAENNGQDLSGGKATVSASDSTYDGNTKAAALSKAGWLGADVGSITYKKGDTTLSPGPTDAGTYTASITVGGQTASVTYTIGKATPTAADFDLPTLNTQNYNGDPVTVAAPTLKSGKTGAGTVTVKYNGSTTAPINAGNYTVTFDVAEGTNYNAASGLSIGTLTINRIEPETPTGLIGCKGQKLSTVVLPEGWSWDAPNTVMNATGEQTFIANYAGSTNYNAKSNVSVMVTVSEKSPANVRITGAPAKKTYGDAPFTLTAAVTTTGSNSTWTWSSSDDAVLAVAGSGGSATVTVLKKGSATITAKYESDSSVGVASASISVDPAVITVKALDRSMTVNDALPAFDVVCEGFVNGDTAASVFATQPAASTAADGKTVGEFAITVTAPTLKTAHEDHYTVSCTDGKLTVQARQSAGSGSYIPGYNVTVDKSENGSVSVSPKNAGKGTTVTITVTPDKGFTLETLVVTDKDGKQLTLTDKGNGKYTFLMPASNVSVRATFMDDNTMLNFFVDVKANDYFYDAVRWAVQNGITTGTDATHFSPDGRCTRAQIVTFLWRAAGSPAPKGTAGFTDVAADAYYAKAVAWAVENGITEGMTDTTFAPDAACTREQAVTFLFRAFGSPAVSGGSSFRDVAADAYYATAVAWAEKHGITGGIGGGLFGSGNVCTRAQIVAFLFRAYSGR